MIDNFAWTKEKGGVFMHEENQKQAQEQDLGKSIGVRIAKDSMTAYINVSPRNDETVTVEELKEELEKRNVVYGVDEEEVERIVAEKLFFQDYPIAHGEPAVDGQDGYYEYLIDTNVDLKPKILEDGSVDYKSMGEVPVVQEDQELVIYHPATPAVKGKSVLGLDVIGRKGKDLLPLKGKGFLVSEDKTVYKAAMTGKATIKENTLTVSNVLVLTQDVSIASGGVSFAGDVVIKGNVLSGAEVRANGNIEVDGCVEAATLVAGKNVVLKNGMQGNGKGKIHAGKDVSGKFFEQVTIEAKGNVSANAIMHCNIKCEESVHVAGKLGIIVGGKVEAYREVEATLIGNMNEIKTIVEVGTSNDIYARIDELENKIRGMQTDLTKLQEGGKKIADLMKVHPDNEELKHNKVNIMRAKISREAILKDLEKEREEQVKILAKITNPKIIVLKSIYPGTMITINGIKEKINSENYNVTYQKNGVEIEFTANI